MAKELAAVARDFCGDAWVLAADLDEIGLREWATRIEGVIAEGTTSTEILMGLRWTLNRLIDSGSDELPVDLLRTVVDLATGIDVALNRATAG